MKKTNAGEQTWFEDWFNSPYYHILYKNRDETEAKLFIDNISLSLNIKNNAKILDLGCGRGRHAIYLSQKGFDVTGIDISPQNIRYANKINANIRMNTNDTNKNGELLFYVHDMRKPFKTNYFDYVVNLFTSFGYFEKDEENYLTISAVAKSLKPNGHLIIDFMNSKKVMDNLVEDETKNISGLQFDINRSIENGFIVKQIKIRDRGENYFFQERVKALTLKDFKKYFDASGFKIINLFGDYRLSKFDEKRSDRLIIISKKIIDKQLSW